MGKRPEIKTTISDAVEYWQRYIDECDLSVDWSEAHIYCWRCGCKRKLERCHIVPHSLGGKDEPENIVLLCKRCHADAPNVSDPEIMWDWIKAYKTTFYDTFWNIQVMKEYEFIYHKSLLEEREKIVSEARKCGEIEDWDKVEKDALEEMKDFASWHFGQPYFNIATMVGIHRMLMKKLAKRYNVEI